MPERRPDPILVDRPEPWLAIITLNREDVRNAISTQMAKVLSDRLDALSGDEQLRALILTGAGDKAFSAGADLKERFRMSPAQRTRHTSQIRDAADRLHTFPVPVVAALRGSALAGGAELAVACDLRVAGESTVIGFPEVKRGIFPGAGAVERLPALIGSSSARWLLFTGRHIDAAEALSIGLVDSVVLDNDVLIEAKRLCREIATKSPAAVRALKKALQLSESQPLEVARERIAAIRAELDFGDDYEEGLAAFSEGREPAWSLTPKD